MRTLRVLFALAVFATCASATTEPSVYKTARITPRDVMIACKDGGTPKIHAAERFVVVSCPLAEKP